MNRRNKPWCWRRWIAPDDHDLWTAHLQDAGCPANAGWVFIERPGRARILVEAYFETRALALAMNRQWGGRIRAVNVREWTKVRPTPPTRIGRRLEIVHDEKRTRKKAALPQLVIPHGLAFGSGEHATTFMLLRALAGLGSLADKRVLDLGTGSGALALAARLFGARKIVATDFDPDAVRTARQNEALNFPQPLIRWKQSDVKKLRPTVRYDLVLANLFSGILGEAAPQIAGSVAIGGQLWLSGILTSQQEEVRAAYAAQGLELIRTCRRGKWIMQQWAARIRKPVFPEARRKPPRQNNRRLPRPGERERPGSFSRSRQRHRGRVS